VLNTAAVGITPSALTKANDTNVTMALGGTSATALLQGVTLTMGWQGTLSPARGGLGADNGAATGIPLFTAGAAVVSPVGTAVGAAAVRYDAAQSLTAVQQVQARQNISAAATDALAYSGAQANGAFEVSQENGTTAVTVQNTTTYVLDQWRVGCANSAGILSCKQQAPGAGMPGSALEVTATTAFTTLASTSFVAISHPIEGYRINRMCWGTTAAQSVTIGFWINTLVAGTASLCIQNAISFPQRSYVANFTTSAGVWEYKTITIPGCQDGTWNANQLIGCCVSFVFAAGSGLISSAGVWLTGAAGGAVIATPTNTNYFATTSNKVTISNVVILPGTEAPSAARSPLIMRPYDQELLTCQRYLEPISVSAMGWTSGTTSIIMSAPFRVLKRAAPTLLAPAGGIAIYANGNFSSTATPTFGAIDMTGATLNIGGYAGMTTNVVAFLTAHPGIKFDARL
jgi:hypothetical protein